MNKSKIISSRKEKAEQFITNSKEHWKPIPNTEHKYYISDKGNVLSLCYEPHILSPIICGDNYLCVRIKGKNVKISRLVAKAFVDNPRNLPLVHHIDHNKHNNSSNNLQWVTYSENTKAYYKYKNEGKQ